MTSAGGRYGTPTLLRALQAVLAALLVLLGVAGVLAAQDRVGATDEIATRLQPLSMDATAVYRSLASADATVTSGFLAGGVEPAAVQARYASDVSAAADGIAHAATQSTDAATADRIAALGEQLPTYTGLVEQARANNRRGLPVGAAYLRRASDLMQTSMLPAAESVRARQAQLLDDAHRRAASFPVGALLAALLALAGLGLGQVWLARRFHRVLNRGLVVATASVLVGLLWWVAAGIGAGASLRLAHAHGEALNDGLGPAQVAALQARASENLALVQRDGGRTEQDFVDRMQRLSRDDGAGGALGAAAALVPDRGGRDAVLAAVRGAHDYLAAHDRVHAAAVAGRYGDAVRLAESAQPDGSAAAFDRLTAALDASEHEQRAAFTEAITAAKAWRTGLVAGTGALALLAVVGAVLGIGTRGEEYR
ncbi:hypothetical protein [Pseudonocardia acaciae]|uniref:hypothetical protein n=1 Tax=Pseudonocardia acaciae TaxID=551276 RepID=UPI0007E8DDB3|nr:hypothetical protein [Pseudonocardia acaciae]